MTVAARIHEHQSHQKIFYGRNFSAGGGRHSVCRPVLRHIRRIAEVITLQIQALTDGLQRDPQQIFDYVHDQIRFVPYFGSKKGAQLTLLEKSGNTLTNAPCWLPCWGRQATRMCNTNPAGSRFPTMMLIGTVTICDTGAANPDLFGLDEHRGVSRPPDGGSRLPKNVLLRRRQHV
jgi:hypothetical protein